MIFTGIKRCCAFGGTGKGLSIRIVRRKSNGPRGTYGQRMERVHTAVQEKRPNLQHGVLLLHNNTRSHIANIKDAIQLHGLRVAPHSPYSHAVLRLSSMNFLVETRCFLPARY